MCIRDRGSPVKTEALVQNDQSFDDLPSLTMTSPLPFEGSHTDSVMTALNEKKPKKKRRLVAKLLAGFLGIIILTAVGLVMWYNNQLAAVDPSSDQQVVVTPVSYTHLDVYKRQLETSA